MNKTKIALTIAKLVGIALLLTIALLATIVIEGLQQLIELIKFLNSEKAENLVSESMLNPITSIPTIKLSNFKPKWMIDLLPREYLNIKHLKAFAKQLRIKSYSKLNKAKLVMALNSAI
jgi:hypothetical protein